MRILRLQSLLKTKEIEALYFESLTDIFYLTGRDLSLGKLWVTPKDAYLIVDARYFQACPSTQEYKTLLLGSKQHHDLYKKLFKKPSNRCGFDGELLSVSSLERVKQEIKKYSQAKVSFVNHAACLAEIRACKEENELKLLKKAAILGSKGFDYVLTLLKEGVTEKFIADQLEVFWKQQGGDGLAFDPIIAFGKNSSKPHYRASNIKLKRESIVLIDIGVKKQHYHSDMTRTVYFGKKPPQKFVKIYETVKKAQEEACRYCKEGIRGKELDAIARDIIAAAGYGEFFCHSLGHGVGLEIHEYPSLSTKQTAILQKGMVVTIEPGIYLPGFGGVRIEDTLIVNKASATDLTLRSKELMMV